MLFALVLFCGCTDGTERRLQLEELERQNRADSLMTNDSLATILADYFDRNGTSNEQLRAHYILGRTYADRGEMPSALAAFQDAINRADTTARDCNYYTLCRVYAQMADIFYKQNLMDECLKCIDKSTSYSLLANDTVMVLCEMAMKQPVFSRLQIHDSVISINERVFNGFLSIGRRQTAAGYAGLAIRSLIIKGKLDLALHYMKIYESESGYFDSSYQIARGREAYYNLKGLYFITTHNYDSAEYYYRKELQLGHDYNNQNMASKGLAELFQQTNHPDSASKYALYSYAMNDSVYAHMATSEVERMQAMYDYSRHQHEAQTAKEKEAIARHKLYVLSLSLLLIIIITATVIWKYRQIKKRHEVIKENYQSLFNRQKHAEEELKKLQSYKKDYEELLSEKEHSVSYLNKKEKELENLRQSEHVLNNLIKDRESEIVILEEKLAGTKLLLSQHPESDETEINILNSTDFYPLMIKSTGNGNKLTNREWSTLHNYIDERLPKFSKFIAIKEPLLTQNEINVCILVRLYFKPKNIANALNLDSSIITRARQSLHKKLFGINGSSKHLDLLIRHIDTLQSDEFDH